MKAVGIYFSLDPKTTDIDALIDEIEALLVTKEIGSTYSADMDDGRFVICAELISTDQNQLEVLLSRYPESWNIQICDL